MGSDDVSKMADDDEELLAMIKAAVTGRDVLNREVDPSADSNEIGDQSLVGQVYPALQGVVTLFTANGASVESPVDEVGCFLFARPAAGPFRLRCDLGTADVVTEWITLT